MFDFALRFSPVAFTLFGKEIYWYGIIVTLGIVLGVIYAFKRAKQSGISSDHMYDYAIFAVVLGIFGARAYYVLSNLGSYNTFYEIIAIWQGGLGIYGGIIAGVIAITVTALIKKQNPLRVLDCAAPAAMIGQILGRWGNYVNQEAFGINTELPWGMRSFVYEQSTNQRLQGTVEYLEKYQSKIMKENPGMTVDPSGFVHPTFLYESLWNLLGFILINILYRKKKFDGQILFMYLGWYGLGRMFIESLRTDSLYLGSTGIRKSQLVALICVVLSVFFIVFFLIKAKAKGVVSLYTQLENGKWVMTDAVDMFTQSTQPDPDEDMQDMQDPEDIAELEALDGADGYTEDETDSEYPEADDDAEENTEENTEETEGE